NVGALRRDGAFERDLTGFEASESIGPGTARRPRYVDAAAQQADQRIAAVLWVVGVTLRLERGDRGSRCGRGRRCGCSRGGGWRGRGQPWGGAARPEGMWHPGQ